MASRNSLLEKILEDLPHSKRSSVKKERKDLNDIFNCHNFISPLNRTVIPQIDLSTQTSNRPQLNMNSHLPNTSSYFLNNQLLPNNGVNSSNKTQLNPQNSLITNCIDELKSLVSDTVDLNSSLGKFGWSMSRDVPLPVILRNDIKLVPMKIVESKIVKLYSNYIPIKVFSYIKMKSYYITNIEAKLLNEINISHCDNYYGPEKFVYKDTVIALNDVLTLHSFLETTKSIFVYGLEKCEFLGFIQISGFATLLPYIIKESSKKYLSNSSTETSSTVSKNNFDSNDQNSEKIDSANSISEKDSSTSNNNEEASSIKNNVYFKPHKKENTEEDDDITIQIDSSSENNFYENSSTELDDNNLDYESTSEAYLNKVNKKNNQLNKTIKRIDSSSSQNSGFKKLKYIPSVLIEDLIIINDLEKIKLDNWDATYLKMICCYAGYDYLCKVLTVKSDVELVCIDDITTDIHLNPIKIKECNLQDYLKLSMNQEKVNFNNQTQENNLNKKIINTKDNTNNYEISNSIPNDPNKPISYTNNKMLNPYNYINNLATNENVNNNNQQVSLNKHINYSMNSLNNMYSSQFTSSSTHPQHSSCSNNFQSRLRYPVNNSVNYNNVSNNRSSSQPNSTSVPSTQICNQQINNHTITTTNNKNYNCEPSYASSLGYHSNSNSLGNNSYGNSNSSISSNNISSNNYNNNSIINELTNCFPSNEVLNNVQDNRIINNNNQNLVNSTSDSSTINYDNLAHKNLNNNSNTNTNVNSNINSTNLNNNSTSRNNLSNSSINNNSNNNLSVMNNLGIQNQYNYPSSSINNFLEVNNELLIKVSTVTLDGTQLKSFSLKPFSATQALLLSEIEHKIFFGIGMVSLKFLLETTFKIQLYDYSSLHELAFYRNGLRPIQGDKLVLYEDFKKFLPQLRQCLLAGLLHNFNPNFVKYIYR